MNKERDIINFDYLTVIIKKEKQAEVLENYACFGWELVNTKDINSENVYEIDLKRPHKLNNKDELQYLQVNMESELNKLGKLETDKHSKSTIIGIITGIIGIGMTIFGILMAIKNYLEVNLLVGGIMLCVTGLTLLIVMTFLIIKISKREIEVFDIKFQKSQKAVEDYCKIAKELLGGKDGRN